MKKLLLLPATFCLMALSTVNAQTPVWSTDIAPILYNNCASCHRSGGIGPFELITYQSAVNYSTNIDASVKSGEMPPWPPDPEFNRLAHERLLTQDEINKISNWVANGTPQGDPNLAPPPPTVNPNGELPGIADLTIQIPTYTSTAQNEDVYQCFVIPSGLNADEYISAFEAIPGNRDIVHHVIVYADTTGICDSLDSASAGPGYVSFGGPGTDAAIMLGGWVPGTPPLEFPNGFGVRIPKNADIVLQIHYPEGSQNQQDSTKVRFFFSKTTSTRNVRIDPALNHSEVLCTMIPSGGLYLPPNQLKGYLQFSNISSLIGDITLLGVAPHMHLIGKSINSYGVYNGDTTNYIDIPEWDFHWQGFYLFRKLKKVPQGTVLYSEAVYDNTTHNHDNPNNPPKLVTAGEASTDEMMITYVIWTPYQPGDENIDIDTSELVSINTPATAYAEQELFTPYPNPATQAIYIKYYLQQPDVVSLSLVSMDGKVIKELAVGRSALSGYHADPYSVADVPSGIYILQMETSSRTLSSRVAIDH